jgi:dihydroflavonol-4-reductase
MSLTAFVSGDSGFVGAHLVRELYARDWTVHVLVRAGSSLEEIKAIPVTIHQGDLVDRNSLQEAMPTDLDAVFHVAADTNFWSRKNAAQDRVNIDGTRHMLETAAEKSARRFIYTSSFATWGFQNTCLNESSPRTHKTDWINYVHSKHVAEQMVLDAANSGLADTVILNPANILGPGDKNNWSRMIRLVQTRKLHAAPPGGGNFCDVREVARAHVQAFHKGGCGEKYLLGGHYLDFVGLARIIGEVLDLPVPGKAAPAWVMKTWARLNTAIAAVTGTDPEITPESAAMVTYQMSCDSTKAQNALDYKFTPTRTLIEDTVEWMKKQGMLS